MKMLIGAFALILAAPVAAQTAPANPHADHSQHQQTPGAPAEHKMDCKCCDKMKEQGGKMDCCDEHAKEHAGQGGHSTK